MDVTDIFLGGSVRRQRDGAVEFFQFNGDLRFGCHGFGDFDERGVRLQVHGALTTGGFVLMSGNGQEAVFDVMLNRINDVGTGGTARGGNKQHLVIPVDPCRPGAIIGPGRIGNDALETGDGLVMGGAAGGECKHAETDQQYRDSGHAHLP